MADANNDGVFSQADIDLVNAIIGGGNTTVHVVDAMGNSVGVPYPMEKVFVSGGTNTRVIVNALKMYDNMTVSATNSYAGDVLDAGLLGKIADGSIKSITTGATDADFSALSQQDVGVALIEGSAYGEGYTSDAGLKFFKDLGIPVLMLNSDNYGDAKSVTAVLGFLLKKEDLASAYIQYMDKVDNAIAKNIGDKLGTATVMTITMSNSVSGTLSDYYALSQLAGGKNIADWPDKTKKFDPTKGDVWLLDEKYNPDYLFHFKSQKYGTPVSEKDLNNYIGYFKDTKAYKDGGYYLVNGTVPIPARLAYMAQIMYSDCFDEGWADSIMLEYLDKFTDNKNVDLTASGFEPVMSMSAVA
jgi:ABC-type Fe3+-hydroxamate transport system substrate-binding protein